MLFFSWKNLRNSGLMFSTPKYSVTKVGSLMAFFGGLRISEFAEVIFRNVDIDSASGIWVAYNAGKQAVQS